MDIYLPEATHPLSLYTSQTLADARITTEENSLEAL